MRDIEIVDFTYLKNQEIESLIKDIVRFTHKRDVELSPIIETLDFYEGVKYTIAYLRLIRNIEI